MWWGASPVPRAKRGHPVGQDVQDADGRVPAHCAGDPEEPQVTLEEQQATKGN